MDGTQAPPADNTEEEERIRLEQVAQEELEAELKEDFMRREKGMKKFAEDMARGSPLGFSELQMTERAAIDQAYEQPVEAGMAHEEFKKIAQARSDAFTAAVEGEESSLTNVEMNELGVKLRQSVAEIEEKLPGMKNRESDTYKNLKFELELEKAFLEKHFSKDKTQEKEVDGQEAGANIASGDRPFADNGRAAPIADAPEQGQQPSEAGRANLIQSVANSLGESGAAKVAGGMAAGIVGGPMGGAIAALAQSGALNEAIAGFKGSMDYTVGTGDKATAQINVGEEQGAEFQNQQQGEGAER